MSTLLASLAMGVTFKFGGPLIFAAFLIAVLGSCWLIDVLTIVLVPPDRRAG